jgi:hypothetical protein
MRTASQAVPSSQPDDRGVSILARTLFRQMREQGYSEAQIIGLSSQLIQLVSRGMRDDLEPAE